MFMKKKDEKHFIIRKRMIVIKVKDDTLANPV